jgi:hypothetical protein
MGSSNIMLAVVLFPYRLLPGEIEDILLLILLLLISGGRASTVLLEQ